MRKNYYKNLTTALLVTSFILTPLSAIPKKAEAQSTAGFVSGLAPAIVRLPQCVGKLGAISKLFGGVSGGIATNEAVKTASGLVLSQSEKLGDIPGVKNIISKIPGLKDVVGSASSESDSVKVNISGTAEGKAILETNANTKVTKANVISLEEKATCLNSIGRLVVKMLLQKITVSTIAWINSGFDGKPAFIQDPGKFFNDIAKNEILQFGLEINNPQLFPFGKVWLQNQAKAFNQKFTDNARYSLNEEIKKSTPQFSAQSFQLDFSQGGWNAWSALTQVPANNPLGFQLMASDELQKRLQGTSQSVAQNTRDALQAASGFLGDQRCADPVNLTRQQDKAGLLARSNGTNKTAPICNRWEYVTPGKLIAESATSTIKYPENNLLKAEDLNDAMAAILDALLSRFSSDLMKKGYANLSNEGADGSFVYNPDSTRIDYSSQTEKDFTPTQLTSSWLQANPDFNIRTDLTQALIDEQRTYSDKLALQNKELNSTTDGKDYQMGAGGMSNAYGLIPAIDQLDYCMPGPHPGWEEDSRNVLDAVTNVIVPVNENDLKNMELAKIGQIAQTFAPLAGAAIGLSIAGSFAVAGASIGSVVPVVGTIIGAIVGVVIGSIVSFFTSPDNSKKVRLYYYAHINPLTGIPADWSSGERSESISAFSSKGGAVQTLNIILERYIDLVHKIYNPKVLPAIYKEATTEFYKLQGYAQMIKNNDDAISSTKHIVNTLGEIKDKVEELNQKFPKGGDEYENELKPQINAFGRLSANMVNGDDIASADSLLKQIIDEKKYIYQDLIKGPFGCEKDLETGKQNLPDQLYQTKRMNYPFPILYTYDMGAGGTIPDPLNSGFANKTNQKATNTLGPGFLSFYSFQTSYESLKYKDCVVDANGVVPQCELRLDDILPLWRPVDEGKFGLRNLGITPNSSTSGPWENAIGVY